ncbi:hypothetical protein BWGOE2_30290 [Bacillus mycoides]|nr:hypothetical protein BWGOE2_30290 [Bacillus mycoides]OFD45164.1 hypothetical protein BWGOE1_31430 [Bacillus mycoides]
MEDDSNDCIGIEFLKIKLYCKSAVGTANYLLLGSLKVAEDKGGGLCQIICTLSNCLYIFELFVYILLYSMDEKRFFIHLNNIGIVFACINLRKED